MASLLDFLSSDEAALGLGLLAAGGPTTDPNAAGFGASLARGVGNVAVNKHQRLQNSLLQSQVDENKAQTAARTLQAQRDREMQQLLQSRLNGGAPAYSGGTDTTSTDGTAAIGINPMLSGRPLGASIGQSTSAGPAGIASQSGGSAFPFSLSDITQLQGMGYKGADNLFQMYKYATDGVKREAGNYYKDPLTGQTRYMPKLGEGQALDANGNVMAAPGYANANAAIKGQETQAIEAARFPFTVGADRTRQITQAGLDTQSYIGADDNTYSGTRLGSALASGAGPLIGLGPAAGPRIGLGGAQGDGQSQGGGSANSPMMVGRNPVTQQSRIALNDNWIKNAYQPTIEAGKSASEALTNVEALRSINMSTGWGTEAKANAANVLAGLGIAPANAQMFATNAQKFQSVAMDRLMKKQVEQKGTATEGDAKRIGQTYVSLQNTPAANDFILDLAQAQASQDQRRAQFYEAALPLAQKAGDLTRVDREWRKIQGSIWADPSLQRWSK